MSSITGVVFAPDYNGRIKVYVFSPNTFTSVDVSLVVGGGSIAGTYSLSSSDYDPNIGAFVIWSSIAYTEPAGTINGSISATLNGETESYDIQWISKTSGYPDSTTQPSGISVNLQPCFNGQSSIWVSGNPLQQYSYTDTLGAVLLENGGGAISPTHIVLYSNSSFETNQSDYVPSSVINVSGAGIKGVLFNVGTRNSGSYTYRLKGVKDDNDFIDLSVDLACQAPVVDGTGTNVNQGLSSFYTIPRYPSTGCTVTGLIVESIPTGSSIFVGSTQYYVGGVIDIGDLNLSGTDYLGVREQTSISSEVGIGSSSFRWETSCGETPIFNVSREILLAPVNLKAKPEVTTFNLCEKTCSYQRTISGTSTHDGDVFIMKSPVQEGDLPIAAAPIVGGVWMAKSEDIEIGEKYIAYAIRYDGGVVGKPTIDANQVCDKECIFHGTMSGTVDGVEVGLVRVMEAPITPASPSVALGIINNGEFNIKSDQLLQGSEYVLYSINLKQR